MVVQAGEGGIELDARVDELVVFRVEPGHLRRQPRALAEQRGPLEFDAVHRQPRRVEHREGEGRRGRVRIDDLGHACLEILVVAVERGDVALQAAVGRTHLEADLVGPDELGVEHRLGRLGRAVRATVEAA